MNKQLIFDPPSARQRVVFGFAAVCCLVFGLGFALFPLFYLIVEIGRGSMPVPLLVFTCMAIAFGGMLVALAVRYRVWFLSYRFTIDKELGICGHSRNGKWAMRTDIRAIRSIVTQPGCARRTWDWVIYSNLEGSKRKVLLNSPGSHPTESAAFAECSRVAEAVSRYLNIPVEHFEWSINIKE